MEVSSEKVTFWGKRFLKQLEMIKYGELTLETPHGETFLYKGDEKGFSAHLKINDWAFCRKLIFRGDVGLGEAYRDGMWESNDEFSLLSFGIQNQRQITSLIDGNWMLMIFSKLNQLFQNLNTRSISKRNIHKHYDLGNNFFSTWLDDSMTYSSAYFKGDYNKSLQEAQEEKYKRILDLAEVKEGDHILEIGCGWGGFTEYAASQGVKVTAVTISKEQFDFAKNRMDHLPFGKLADIKLLDYRDLKGRFDSVVSIEMIEAIGSNQWKTYFKAIKNFLKKGKSAVIQGITIPDESFNKYMKGTDFIQQYIFPGGMLVSEGIVEHYSKMFGMKSQIVTKFGRDYYETLKRWRESFKGKANELTDLGYDHLFQKIWDYYLFSCQAAFYTGKINVVHAKITN